MLINFSVENYLSFDKKREFSMIPSTKVSDKPDHTVKTGDHEEAVSLLKHGVIYGANASGKSNLLRSFKFLHYTVTRKLPPSSKDNFCRVSDDNKTKISSFEIQFHSKSKCYSYGFSALLSENRITSEVLETFGDDGSKQLIYKWCRGSKPEIFEMPAQPKAFNKLETYLDDFDSDGNQLFLTFMNKQKKYDDLEEISYYPAVYNWIDAGIVFCSPSSDLIYPTYFSEKAFTKISGFMAAFDTGISSVISKPIPLSEFELELPERLRETLLKEFIDCMQENLREIQFIKFGADIYRLELQENNELLITILRFAHSCGGLDFSIQDESDGTSRLFELLCMLLGEEDKIYIIDELERSLHPKLTEKLLKLFAEIQKNKRIQILFSTHEASIMTLDMFRRDEIWFTEKDNQCTTNLYPLDKFTKEYDSELKTAYFEGRYGAIPVFREII